MKFKLNSATPRFPESPHNRSLAPICTGSRPLVEEATTSQVIDRWPEDGIQDMQVGAISYSQSLCRTLDER